MQEGCLCFATGDSRDCRTYVSSLSLPASGVLRYGKTGTLALVLFHIQSLGACNPQGGHEPSTLEEGSRTRVTNGSRNLATKMSSWEQSNFDF